MKREVLLPATLLALLVAGCSAPPQESHPPGLPPDTGDGWAVGSPADAGIDASALDRLGDEIENGEFPNTHALLIEHKGTLVYERYFSGTDERWGEDLGEITFDRDTLHDVRSISKSVTSVVLGLALENDLAAVEESVFDHFPDMAPADGHRAISLHHLLTMTPGLEWNEMKLPYTDPDNDEIRLYREPDPARYVLSRPLAAEPGSGWYYSGGTTQVLADVIHRRTGKTLTVAAEELLFEPLGIADFEWLGPGTWTPDNPAAMSGLRLRGRDLAKIGSVFLHGGRWNGAQVVPRSWVELSMTRHVQEIRDWSAGGFWGYGYQWWVGGFSTGERVVAGFGNGDQRLFVLPDDGIAVTILAGEYNKPSGNSWKILERILSIVRDN
ncbi:MAG: serine hydrolase [Acidobacteria bacterium]|nr:serine hydrolase [Acidobacteriota bacterium]NIM63830.1 serine hydrolase [Acidobacteriota bacterium]NIO59764.1 serine hydrolase [Acidobacteriota bacterium]NIQ30847.1 serine hydrolase [Acidobacteriota bacterium]NIQ85920.1 serine hydrolase [Acidobacteriota bacterium]